MTKEQEFYPDDKDYTSISEEWKKVDWDAIQRMRFANADAEIDPEDGYQFNKKED
jgi:hypothetical protein